MTITLSFFSKSDKGQNYSKRSRIWRTGLHFFHMIDGLDFFVEVLRPTCSFNLSMRAVAGSEVVRLQVYRPIF